jgi:hypothetical protein
MEVKNVKAKKPKKGRKEIINDILDVVESICYGLLIAIVLLIIFVFLYNHNWLPIITFT